MVPSAPFGRGAPLSVNTGSSYQQTGGSYATVGNIASPSARIASTPLQITPAPVFKSAIGVNQLLAPTTPTPVPKAPPKYVAPWNNPLNVSRVPNGRGGYWTA
jgi:hypothetical protein